MKIYNLFPLLAGPLPNWTPHLERAADLGFDWVFVNPIQQSGRSGSLYSIADYFRIDRRFLRPRSRREPDAQVRDMAAVAGHLGLRVMTDLVINHCAVDSDLVREHPSWFLQEEGRVAHPYCLEEDGSRTVWHDLARFDHAHGVDPDGLFGYCCRVVEHLVDLGFSALRCDAAYQLPPELWRRLIAHTRARHPEVLFLAETLGCSPEQARDTAAAGFDYIFNSAKWWDYSSPWLLKQYDLTRCVAPSVAFPESHDTERLFTESGHNPEALKQRYLFTALFSSGVLMPIGYEFGFRHRLHVVNTRPGQWEQPAVDLRDFIRHVNAVKGRYPVFHQDGPLRLLQHPDPGLLLMWKSSENGHDEALLVLNKDPCNGRHFHCDDLYRLVQSPPPLKDVSPEWAMGYLPTPFEFDLGPGMGRVFVTEPR